MPKDKKIGRPPYGKVRTAPCGTLRIPRFAPLGRKGFSDLLVLLLGMVFFSIAALLSYDISSSEGQSRSVAESAAGNSKLDFYAQCMQADFYNNLLQSKFEQVVVNFLMTKGPHTIDPEQSFKTNMGGGLQEDLEAAAGTIVSGDAATVYAAAYSNMPGISCEPISKQGAWAPVTMKEQGDSIILSGLSVGQAITCKDSEVGASVDIDLQGRGYSLQTRALLMFRRAVEAINQSRAALSMTEGVTQIANGWRLADDQSVKTDIMSGPQGWGSKIAVLPMLLQLTTDDGVVVDKASIRVLGADGAPYTATDITEAVCYGDMQAAAEGKSGPTQTCRPDGLNLELGLSKEEAEKRENAVTLDFEPSTAAGGGGASGSGNLEITVTKYGVTSKIKIPALGKIIANALGSALNTVFASEKKGVVTYSGTTHLCNAFKGKPDSAVVSGRVGETDKKYLPAGVDYAYFDFVSTPQALDTSTIENNEDCSSPDKTMMEDNVVALLTNYGQEEFQFNIIEDPNDPAKNIIDQDALDKMAETISKNDMVTSTGETTTITLTASVVGDSGQQVVEPATAQVKIDPKKVAEADAVMTGKPPAEDKKSPEYEDFVSGVKTGTDEQAFGSSMKLTDSVSTTLSSLGATKASESMSKSTAAICKLAGLKNLMELDDTASALFAVCGIAKITNSEGGAKICGIAGIYQVAQSGNLQATVAALNGLLAQSGSALTVNAEMLAEAFKSGNTQDIFAAVSTLARLSGDTEASALLASGMQLASAAQTGDLSAVLTSALSIAGDTGLGGALGGAQGNLATVFSALNSFDSAIKSNNPEAALNSISQLASGMGLQNLPGGVGSLAGISSAITGAANAIMDLNEALDACEGKVQWDWLCTTPQIGDIVCGTYGNCEFQSALPSFDPKLLCNDLVFDLGFQIDCTCVYKCPSAPYVAMDKVSWGIDLNYLKMLLNTDQYADLFKDFDLETFLQMTGLMDYCKLDP